MRPGDENKAIVKTARKLRLAVVKNLYMSGQINEATALEALNGRLSHDDPESVFEDAFLLSEPDALTLIDLGVTMRFNWPPPQEHEDLHHGGE